MELIKLTLEGKEKLEKEKDIINNQKLPEAEKRLHEARQLGDLSENAEYDAAKEEVELYRSRLAEIDQILDNSEIIDKSTLDGATVQLGCRVKIFDITNDEELEYEIVSETEANLNENKINIKSPIASKIIGHKKRDIVKVKAPSGIIELKILNIYVD